MLKQVLAVAVVGLLAAGCASANDSNWGYRNAPPPAYRYSPYYVYPHYVYPRYAPIRYVPRYCPPPRWGWQRGYYAQYPHGYHGDSWRGRDDHDDHDQDDHGGWDNHGNGDWDRHH